MPLLDHLDRKFHRFAIPRLTLLLVLGQVVVLCLTFSPTWKPVEAIGLIPNAAVYDGEWWRLATFLFIPPAGWHPVLALFGLYFFLLMGNALEDHWGSFRYNLFILIAYICTVAAAFLTPDTPATNVFIGGSVFLAFAALYPEFEIYLFFILPVKIKYLALFTWIMYAIQLLFGDWPTRYMVLAATTNLLIFFWHTLLLRISRGRRKMAEQAKAVAKAGETLHRCAACGATEKTHPQAEFRYCTKCQPATCFCEAHIRAHAHLQAEAEKGQRDKK
jgi:hypothetical protein